MLTVYEEHKTKVESLQGYIHILKEIASIPMEFPNENSSKALAKFVSMPQKRGYDYDLIIVTLYGIFESFIEATIENYLITLNKKIKQYSDLPEELIKNHLDLSAKLISNASVKYHEIRKEEIINNLHSCLNQSTGTYRLNTRAYTQHTANFRIETIQELFKLIGIGDIRNTIKQNSPLTNFLIKHEGYNEYESKNIPDSKYFEFLSDLVERRNIIAHGSKTDELLSLNFMYEYSKYIIALMESIHVSVTEMYYKVLIRKNIAQQLGLPLKIYNNKIVCINSSNYHIKTGQVLIGENVQNLCFWGAIESIQLNGKDVIEIEADKALDVGMSVPFKAKEQFTYYLIPEE